MAAPPSPPHRSRHPELRHSATRGCRLSSPHPTSLSAPAAPPAATPRSAGPLWRSPHDQRFGPSPCTHPPVGRPRPPPSSPRLKRLNIPAAAPPVPRTGAANGSAALPASPPRPAPLRILFSPYALGNAYGEKRDRGGHRCYSRSNRDTHATRRKTTRRSPVLSPPPPHHSALSLGCFPHVATHTPPPQPRHVATAPRAPAAPRPPRPRPAVSYRGCGERDARFSLPGGSTAMPAFPQKGITGE
ncbi:uncharacterized protein [Taeniopygia guttata]|uniref:uncharacterized protein n=1 Tax=Taeniopygia guttata TaxID=59729 RepID=UPI003BB9660F